MKRFQVFSSAKAMAIVMGLKPEAEFPKLYGVTRKELIARAGM